jgi:hypothetical protein
MEDLSRRFQAIQMGHADVHNQHVRLQIFGLFDRLLAVDGFANDFPVTTYS